MTRWIAELVGRALWFLTTPLADEVYRLHERIDELDARITSLEYRAHADVSEPFVFPPPIDITSRIRRNEH